MSFKQVIGSFAAGAFICLLTALPIRVEAAEKPAIPNLITEKVRPLNAPDIHNLFEVGTNLFSGSTPEGEAGFAALKKLGIATIISVDGAQPDVELARKHGMRYIHLPHGYDGIATNIQLQLAKVAQSLPGPLYVHCHHGKHRGPTAVAIICMAQNNWTPAEAEAWLVAAGTATNYPGLYEVVRQFQKPSSTQLQGVSSEFPERAQVSGLVDAMVVIDERWEHLKAVRRAGYQTPKEHPDIKPANEAVILWEHYRELQRSSDSARHDAPFIDKLKLAESEAREAERLLNLFALEKKTELRLELDKAFDAMAQSCAACHKAYRDPAGIKSW